MDTDVARRRLTSLRAEVLAGADARNADFDATVAASVDSNADDEHDPEGATLAFERQQLATLRDRARRRLEDIDAALGRLDAGSYGSCEVCGRPIGDDRLAALPAARRCVRCAAKP